MKELGLINLEHVSDETAETYRRRKAARAVVFDQDGNIAVLHAKNKNYYKLPGGGIESGEDPIIALKRECQEEVGCTVEVLSELGSIIEYRTTPPLHQISYCYIAKLIGTPGPLNLDDGEVEDGFEPVWLSYPGALKAIEGSRTDTDPINRFMYMTRRDGAILRAAEAQQRIRS